MECSDKILGNSQSGFSLMELIIVIAIIAISASIATLNFNNWQNKGLAESQIKQMISDISELRYRAVTRKQPVSVVFNSSNYILKAYTSIFRPYSSYSQQLVLPSGTKSVNFPLVNSTGVSYTGQYNELDERGLVITSNVTSVFLGGNGNQGSVNCFNFGGARINAGKSSGGVCNDK